LETPGEANFVDLIRKHLLNFPDAHPCSLGYISHELARLLVADGQVCHL